MQPFNHRLSRGGIVLPNPNDIVEFMPLTRLFTTSLMQVEDLPVIDKDSYKRLATSCSAGRFPLVKSVEVSFQSVGT